MESDYSISMQSVRCLVTLGYDYNIVGVLWLGYATCMILFYNNKNLSTCC